MVGKSGKTGKIPQAHPFFPLCVDSPPGDIQLSIDSILEIAAGFV